MSIIKLTPENFQTYKLIANPKKVFHSRSDSGVTGQSPCFQMLLPDLKKFIKLLGLPRKDFQTMTLKLFAKKRSVPSTLGLEAI